MFQDKDLIPLVSELKGSLPNMLSFDHHNIWFTAVNHQNMTDGVADIVVAYLTGNTPYPSKKTIISPN